MRSDRVLATGDHHQPQTRSELQAWIRDHLRLASTLEAELVAAIDAVFTRHERLWQESKQEAIQALSSGFADKMARVKTELSARDATVSSISRYFEALVAALIGVRLAPLLEGSRRADAALITDVRSHWAATWILAVARAGVMEPFANHAFQPRTLVRRGIGRHHRVQVVQRRARSRGR